MSERQIEELLAENAALRAENEALLADLKDAEIHGICSHCKYSKDEPNPPCEETDYDCMNCTVSCPCHECLDGSGWQWAGIRPTKPANVCG